MLHQKEQNLLDRQRHGWNNKILLNYKNTATNIDSLHTANQTKKTG